jgi:hypothetical protein
MASTANNAGKHLATRRTPSTIHYSFRRLEELWEKAGGNQAEAPLMAAIALAESGGNPFAVNHNTNGTVDRGLWQINSVHGDLSTLDPAANARAAVQIRKESGLGAWVTYKTGAYKTYLTSQNIQSGTLKISPNSPFLKQAEEAAKTAEKGGTDAESGGIAQAGEGGAINKLLDTTLFGGSFVVNAILVIAGAFLAIYGIMIAVRPREQAFSLPKVPAMMPMPV